MQNSVPDRSEFIRHTGVHESGVQVIAKQVRSYSPLPPGRFLCLILVLASGGNSMTMLKMIIK